MIRIEHAVTIDRPTGDVFAYLTDPDKLAEWQTTAHGARLDSESMGEGAHVVETRTFLGRRMETRLEVAEYEPGSRFTLQALSGPIPFRVTHRLEAADGGTWLQVVLEGEPGGFFRLAEPLVERQARQQVDTDFQRLKEILESR